MTERSPDGGFLSRWSRVKTGRAPATREDATGPTLPAAVSSPPPAVPRTTLPISAPHDGDGVVLMPADVAPATVDAVESAPPAPTLQDAAAVPAGGDVARFMARDVSPEVRNVALKRLFADPAFNVMDGLDTYIDDYGRPDPLPAASLRKMVAGAYLRLFDDEAEGAATPAPPASPPSTAPSSTSTPLEGPANEDPDLRLQPDDADRPPGPGPGAGADPGRER
jgi:hypothetical protein